VNFAGAPVHVGPKDFQNHFMLLQQNLPLKTGPSNVQAQMIATPKVSNLTSGTLKGIGDELSNFFEWHGHGNYIMR